MHLRLNPKDALALGSRATMLKNLNKFERNMEEEKRKKIESLAKESPQGQFAEKIKQKAKQLRKE